MIQDLTNNGAEAILLACTELGMLIDESEVNIPLYDTTLLHVNEAISWSMK